MEKFTKAQIRSEVAQVQQYHLARNESPVYNAWAELALKYLEAHGGAIAVQGFTGFFQRTTDEIIYDLHEHGLVEED